MSTEDIVNHGRRIAELERKVSALYERIGQLEPGSTGSVFASDAAPPDPREDPRVLGPLQADNKMEAIKAYREITGVGLAEAKDAVDSIVVG